MIEEEDEIIINKINEVLKTQNITADKVELYYKKDQCLAYLIDCKYIMRISKSGSNEHRKQKRVHTVSNVPKVYSDGSFSFSGQTCHYSVSDYVQGEELYGVLQELTEEQQISIGRDIAEFLTELHSITGSSYDIGHYIPTIPEYGRSWKEGHKEYAEYLRKALSEMEIDSESEKAVSAALEYIDTNIDCLDYQTGARLLHNDFHPKNIIVNNGKISGVIDWECSQFGEEDFELAHLFHWCIYPPDQGKEFGALLGAIVENLGVIHRIPNFDERLTIYQLEHELNQLIWNGKNQLEERTNRMNGWLNGQINSLLAEWI